VTFQLFFANSRAPQKSVLHQTTNKKESEIAKDKDTQAKS
jgi:hypothetical protein